MLYQSGFGLWSWCSRVCASPALLETPSSVLPHVTLAPGTAAPYAYAEIDLELFLVLLPLCPTFPALQQKLFLNPKRMAAPFARSLVRFLLFQPSGCLDFPTWCLSPLCMDNSHLLLCTLNSTCLLAMPRRLQKILAGVSVPNHRGSHQHLPAAQPSGMLCSLSPI